MNGEQLVNKVFQLREGGNVERSHTVRHQPGYTVGKHSFDAALLIELLHPSPTLGLYRACLLHDLHERWTGDLPHPAKVLDPELATAMNGTTELVEEVIGIEYELTAEDEQWLKAVDLLEFYLWSLDELNAGNDHVRRCAEDAAEKLANMDLPDEVARFFENLEEYGWRRTDERIG